MVYEWERELVIIYYMGGPFPESPWDVEKGSLEARSGLFGLDEVSELGVMVSKIRQAGKLDEPIFIPWGSMLSMSTLTADEPEEDTEEADQPEPE